MSSASKGNTKSGPELRRPLAGLSITASNWTAKQVHRVGLAVGALQLVVVGFIIGSSGYLKDDYPFIALGRKGGFSGAELSRSVFGSFVPGFQAGFSILASFHPIPRWPAVVIPLILYGLALFLFFRLAELLVGTRPLLIVLMVVAGLSGVLAISLVWWTAGLNSLPAVVCDLLALDGLVRHSITGKWRYLWVSVVTFAVGVSFYDASAAFLAVLVMFTGLYLAQGNDWSSLWRAFSTRIWLWLGYAAPIVFSLAWRSAHHGQYTLDTLPSIGGALRFAGAGWAQGFVPSTLGISFTSISAGALRWLLVLVGQVLFFGLVGFSVYRRREAWRAWVVFGAGFAAIELIAAIGRAGAGDLFALNTVYWTGQPFFLSVAIALAFFPMQRKVDEAESGAAQPSRSSKVDPRFIALAGLLSLVVCGLGIRSIWVVPERTSGAMNATYVHNVAQSWTDAQQASAHPFVWNTIVPSYVLTPFFTPYDRVATTAGLLVDLRYDQPSGEGYLANAVGELVPAVPKVTSYGELGDRSATTTGNGSTCVRDGSASRFVRVPLNVAVPEGNWFLRLGYSQSSGFSTPVSGELLRFHNGAGALVVPDNGSIGKTALSIEIPKGASVCVTAADFEAPEPKTGAPIGPTLGP